MRKIILAYVTSLIISYLGLSFIYLNFSWIAEVDDFPRFQMLWFSAVMTGAYIMLRE